MFQKSIAPDANPYLTLIINYIVAVAAAIVCYFVTRGEAAAISDNIRRLNWAAYLLGFSVFGIELGVLLLYRGGWNLSTDSLVINIAVAVVLIPVGLFLFREHLSIVNYFGTALCLAGLVLVIRN